MKDNYALIFLQCTRARSPGDDMGIAESNTYAHNNTSHLSPKVVGRDQAELQTSTNRTSATNNQNLSSGSKPYTSGGSKMSSAAVSSPGTGPSTGVRQNLNELDVLLDDLSKAR